MLIIPMNLTSREAYAQYGVLTDERMESLFEAEEKLETTVNNGYYVQEAAAQYPVEDFLQDVIAKLQAVFKKLRGDNKEALNNVITHLEGIQDAQARATEYGIEELNKIS